MAEQDQNPERDGADRPESEEPIRFTDKRRIDPETGRPRHVEGETGAEEKEAAAGSGTAPADPVQDPLAQAEQILRDLPAEDAEDSEAGDPVSVADAAGSPDPGADPLVAEEPELEEVPADQSSAGDREAELQADLQRLQAEYVNYRRRVERDRAVERDRTVGHVITGLMPVLDDIHAARQAGDLADGPFAAIAAKLESLLQHQGLERIDEEGVPFDPSVHEALMQQPHPEIPADHVAAVLRAGYRHGDRVLRAAQVMVSTGPAE
ncbi:MULTISPECIES: nucleotide exchange factor GrpE [Actinomycetes]|uniref:Protein GrpE n=2 Tax=Actinomycetes TaxID=1760 RepID=A0ABP6LZY4_9MICC